MAKVESLPESLPNTWAEIIYPTDPDNPNDPDGADVDEALDFLHETYDWRYRNLDSALVRSKTKKRKDQKETVRSVRIFVHRGSDNELDMCTHFYLRLMRSKSYVLTVGVAEGIQPATLDDDVRQVCRYLKEQDGFKIDVINERPLPYDLLEGEHNTERSKIVGNAFRRALDADVFKKVKHPYKLPPPWPTVVYRYETVSKIP